MSSISEVIKRRKFEKIYKSHVDDVYRICLHFSKDQARAEEITAQVFADFYKEFDKVDSDHIFAHLVHQAKRLSTGDKDHNYASGEVRE